MLADRTAPQGLPAATALAPHTEAVLVEDFLAPAAETAARMAALASRGARGHLVMVADPVEETFPSPGAPSWSIPRTGSGPTAGRVQALREGYVERLAAHREALRRDMRRFGWTLTLHRTDRPASQVLLALYPLPAGVRRDAAVTSRSPSPRR